MDPEPAQPLMVMVQLHARVLCRVIYRSLRRSADSRRGSAARLKISARVWADFYLELLKLLSSLCGQLVISLKKRDPVLPCGRIL
jgi:hypothetical protein